MDGRNHPDTNVVRLRRKGDPSEVERERLASTVFAGYGLERTIQGRHGALLALAGGLPAPILAERIGIHQARAGQWVRLAGATYVENVATRNAS
jgi:hypothetical protein